MSKHMKKEKGITLISLVITIIVLLILAGISILMVTGDNGIILNAKKATVESRKGQIQEAVLEWKAKNELKSKNNGTKNLSNLLDTLEDKNLIEDNERTEIEETGELTLEDSKISIIKEEEYEEYNFKPKYVLKITTKDGVTTKYEDVPSALAVLQDDDLIETIGTLEYDTFIQINKKVTLSGKIHFTNNNSGIQMSDKMLTLKDLTVDGIAFYPIMGMNKNSKIYVGENSNVSSIGIRFGIGMNYGTLEIHSGTYKGAESVYCGGDQSGRHSIINISGSDTYLIGNKHIFSSVSNAHLTVVSEVNIIKEDATGEEIFYHGGGATFNIPESYTIYNNAGGSYTRNTTE